MKNNIVLAFSLLMIACAAKEPPPKPAPKAEVPPAVIRPTKEEGTKIGVLLPLSEPNGRFGEAVLNGINCAIGLFEPCAAPPTPIQIIVKNTSPDPDNIAAAVMELIDQEKVSAIIGPLLSQQLEAIVSIAETKNIPILSLAPKKAATATRNFIFQHTLLPEKEVSAIVKQATQMEINNFLLLYPQNPYGEEYAELFRQALEKIGKGKIIATKTYPADTPDFTGYVEQLFAKTNGKKTIGLFVPDSFRQAIKIAEALDALSLSDVRLIGTSRWYHPKLLAAPLHSLEGALLDTPFYEGSTLDTNQHFQNDFTQTYGTNPAWLEAAGFDAMQMILHAMQSKGNNYPPDIRDGLKGMENFQGVVGPITWDPEGISDWPLQFLTIQDKKFTPVAK